MIVHDQWSKGVTTVIDYITGLMYGSLSLSQLIIVMKSEWPSEFCILHSQEHNAQTNGTRSVTTEATEALMTAWYFAQSSSRHCPVTVSRRLYLPL